jgi:hypothetical protein
MLLVLTAHALAQNRPINQQRFDGQWWISAAPEEQQGFVAGYGDCYDEDVKGPTKSNGRLFEYPQAVTDFYKKHPQQIATPLRQVLWNVFTTLETKYPAQPGGEVWDEPHGFFDGQYWKESVPKERVGYIEGYLLCYENEMKRPPAHFSKGAREYVELITNYFSDRHANHEDDKIANVLYRFRDQSRARPR